MARRLSTLLAALVMVLAAGCGSDGPGAGETDLVKLVPSGSVLYGEVTVRPDGERGEAASAYFGRILDTEDVGEEAAELLDRAFNEGDAKLSYTKDVEPWLGDEVGAFLSSVSPEPEGAVLLQTTDEAAAEKAIDKLLGADAKERTHEKVEYRANDDVAAGIVEGSVVIGTEDGIKEAIEASTGQSLADDEDYEKALEGLEEERLAHVYLDGRKLLDVIPKEGGGDFSGGELELVRRLAQTSGAAAVTVTDDSASLDFRASVKRLRSLGILGPEAETNASPTLEELPAGALASYAFVDAGGFIEAGFDDPGRLGVTEQDIAAARTLVKDAIGQDLDELVGDLGDARFFADGSDVATLDFGVVFETPSPEKQVTALRRAVRKVGSGASLKAERVPGGIRFRGEGLPAPITVTAEDEGLVLSFRRSPAEVSSPSETLGEDPDFEKAVDQLGEGFEPTATVNIEGLLTLVESFGASSEEGLKETKRYLDEVGSITYGDRVDGDDSIQRLTVGLK